MRLELLGEVTISPRLDMRAFASREFSFSYARQHMSRPQTPEILLVLSGKPCSFAILIETNVELGQPRATAERLPHMPTPPSVLA